MNKTDHYELATQASWRAYCEAVGGNSYSGKPLPKWEVLVCDKEKGKIVNAWRAAVKAGIEHYERTVIKQIDITINDRI